MKFAISLSAMLLLTVILFGTADADGMMFTNRKFTLLEPGQRAIIIHNGVFETIFLQVAVKGDVNNFGWVIPVPTYPYVTMTNRIIFNEIEQLTPPYRKPHDTVREVLYYSDDYDKDAQPVIKKVQVAQDFSGSYKINLIKPDETALLYKWLKKNKFQVSQETKTLVDEYSKKGFSFVAVNVTRSKKDIRERIYKPFDGWLQPIKITFKSDKLFYPMKLSSLNPGGTNITAWIISEHRARFEHGLIQWANWVDPRMLEDSKCNFLANEITDQRFLSRIECEWTDNKTIKDDIYFINEIDLPFPKQRWDRKKKEFVMYDTEEERYRKF